jgi:aldehyde dehydrogenase (NAD+)
MGSVVGFDSDEEAIAIANNSRFGLSGSVYSADAGRAYDIALQLRTGGVSINGGAGTMSSAAPFGVIRRSGYGRKFKVEGINEFTFTKTISFRTA